jgi:peptidoglycan/xylan/chitin deacetylase (PgdA/CDA1 family)
MRGTGQLGARLAGVLLALGLCASAVCAQPCNPASQPRAIELQPGQNVGTLTDGFEALPLKDHEVVLTFDDGPDPLSTRRVLDILKERCVTATFFPLGERAEREPALIRRAIAEGHAIGGHTWSHPALPGLSLGAAAAEILGGFRPLKSAGAEMRLFRVPQLAASRDLLDWLKARGVSAVSADIDPRDWAGDPPAQTLQRIKKALAEKKRGVILLHDNMANTARLLPALLDFLAGEGYRVVPLRAAPLRPG